MVTTPPPSMAVRISLFEYECCRTQPAVGDTITGALLAHPTTSARSPVRVTAWDRDRADSENGETLHSVERVERFPQPLLTEDGAFEAGGAVVTLTDLVLVEPTPQQITDYRAAQDVARRPIHITAPPAYFGPTVPDRGHRIFLDLEDPRAQVSNRPHGAQGLVTGVTRQVSEAVSARGITGIVAYRRAPAGAPTAKITHDMFVVVVLDEPS